MAPTGGQTHVLFIGSAESLPLDCQGSPLDLGILRNTSQVYCKMPLSWNLSHVFLLVRRAWLWVWGRKITEVKCHFHPMAMLGLIISCLGMHLGYFPDENAFQMRTSR